MSLPKISGVEIELADPTTVDDPEVRDALVFARNKLLEVEELRNAHRQQLLAEATDRLKNLEPVTITEEMIELGLEEQITRMIQYVSVNEALIRSIFSGDDDID